MHVDHNELLPLLWLASVPHLLNPGTKSVSRASELVMLTCLILSSEEGLRYLEGIELRCSVTASAGNTSLHECVTVRMNTYTCVQYKCSFQWTTRSNIFHSNRRKGAKAPTVARCKPPARKEGHHVVIYSASQTQLHPKRNQYIISDQRYFELVAVRMWKFQL